MAKAWRVVAAPVAGDVSLLLLALARLAGAGFVAAGFAVAGVEGEDGVSDASLKPRSNGDTGSSSAPSVLSPLACTVLSGGPGSAEPAEPTGAASSLTS